MKREIMRNEKRNEDFHMKGIKIPHDEVLEELITSHYNFNPEIIFEEEELKTLLHS